MAKIKGWTRDGEYMWFNDKDDTIDISIDARSSNFPVIFRDVNGMSILFKSNNINKSKKYVMKFMRKNPIIKPRSIRADPSAYR